MYENFITINFSKVMTFLSSEECFTPSNPVYKAVQIALEEMGFEPECNHVFRMKNPTTNLHFTHKEVELYSPVWKELQWISENREKNLTEAEDQLLRNLGYIFFTDVKPEDVKKVLN